MRMTHIWNSFGHKIEVKSKRVKKFPIEFSKADRETYYKYLSVENISSVTGKDFNTVLSENGISNPPNWWYLLQ